MFRCVLPLFTLTLVAVVGRDAAPVLVDEQSLSAAAARLAEVGTVDVAVEVEARVLAVGHARVVALVRVTLHP